MVEREKEAYEYIKKASEKQNPGFFSKLFSNKESRLEESLDLLEKAANIFKLVKKWQEAGDTMMNCAKIQNELNSDCAQSYIEASHCFSFVDKEKSIEAQIKALESYVNKGRFQLAGKIQKQIAEKYEEDFEYLKAASSYKKAADFFSMESMNSKSYEQGCLLKYADLLSSLPDNKSCFPEACQVRLFSRFELCFSLFLY